MDYIKIDNVFILGTNLKTIDYLNTNYIKIKFNEYFCNSDLIEILRQTKTIIFLLLFSLNILELMIVKESY